VLYAYWLTKESSVTIGAELRLNHPEFRNFLKRNPDLSEKLLSVLVRRSQGLSMGEDHRWIEVGGTLEDAGLPDKLAQYVRQIPIWRDFLKPFSEGIAHLRHSASITAEGYYRFTVELDFFKFTIDRWAREDDNMGSSEFWSHELFDFDPKNDRPAIEERGVYWVLPEKKVFVILLFESADEAIADHYGFRHPFDVFMHKKAESEVSEKKRIKEYSEWVDEEIKKKASELQDSLLG
jgi:hypothetical protein